MILLVHHAPTPLLRTIAEDVLTAAREAAAELASLPDLADADPVLIHPMSALEPDVDALRAASGLILGTPANLGYVSGALKHWVDSTLWQVGEECAGLPMSWWIRGGLDVTGAARAMRTLTRAYGWEPCAAPVEWVGERGPAQVDALRAMAQGVVGVAALGRS